MDMLIARAVGGWVLVSAYLVVLAVDGAWAALQLARPQLNPAWADANLTKAQASILLTDRSRCRECGQSTCC